MDKKDFIENLYFDPPKNFPKKKNSNFHVKKIINEEEKIEKSQALVSLKNKNIIMGSVIIQNYETIKNPNKKYNKNQKK